VAGFVLLGVADQFLDVSWPFYVGMVTTIVGWEITKWRMRRLKAQFEPHFQEDPSPRMEGRSPPVWAGPAGVSRSSRSWRDLGADGGEAGTLGHGEFEDCSE
jgi:hypothetical protein